MAVDIVWFRRDLRLDLNPAWAAANRERAVCPLFVIDPRLFDTAVASRKGALLAALRSLDEGLAERGGRLRVEEGDPAEVVPAVAAEWKAGDVHLNREVTPYGSARDRRVAANCRLTAHDGLYLHPPGSILTDAGEPYRVFTAFHRKWAQRPPDEVPDDGPDEVTGETGMGIPRGPESPLPMGESAARTRLEGFLDAVDRYAEDRDLPGGTSRLSVDLKYGTISPLAIHRRLGTGTEGRRAFLRQLAWRDFHGHLMAAMPETVSASMRPELRTIAWNDDPEGLEAWKRGQTGFPIVDAGMRQLAADGWIHNRIRMVVASFLVKDLLIDWRLGERHMRRLLIDGDVAQNVGNWQWVAGTGTDAAPYFRVLNPVNQSLRFDPDGEYIRRWVPELAGLGAPEVHAPWEVPPLDLAAAGVTLGADYPAPIVDHAAARQRAIEAYDRARSA